MKRIYWTLLFVLLFPLLAFAEDSKVTFSPSSTQLQGQPAVICETPYYRIKLPKNWTFDQNYYKDTMMALTGFSPDYHLNITIGYTKPLNNTESDNFDQNFNKFIDEIKNTPQLTIKEIENIPLPNTNCKRLIIFVSNKSIYTVMYIIINNQNYPFIINFLSYPSEYESKLPLFDEIVTTLEFK